MWIGLPSSSAGKVRAPLPSRRDGGLRRGALLHPVSGLGAGGGCGRDHQPQALQQKHGPLCGAAPNKLAPFPRTILHVHVSTRVLQAAVLEGAVDEHAVVQDHVLIFENHIFVSRHGWPLQSYHPTRG